MQGVRIIGVSLGLAMVLSGAVTAAEAEPKPLDAEEIARAEEALRQLTADEQPVEVPKHITVLKTMIRRQLDDCQAYLQVEMGSRAGLAFLAAQRAMRVLDEELDDTVRGVLFEQIAELRSRLDALARRLLQDEDLVPLDPERSEGPVLVSDRDWGDREAPAEPDEGQRPVASEPVLELDAEDDQGLPASPEESDPEPEQPASADEDENEDED